MKLLIICFLFICSSIVHADEVRFSMMKTNMQLSYLPHKNLALTTGDIAAEDVSFAGLQVGETMFWQEASPVKPYLSIFFGPVYADENCPRVTGELEFVINVEAGLEEDGFRIGLNYFHMSNANLKSPNDGLDKILFGLTAVF